MKSAGRGVPSPFLIPLNAFGISILDALGASRLELGPPTFQTEDFLSYAPGWAPGLPLAKSGPVDKRRSKSRGMIDLHFGTKHALPLTQFRDSVAHLLGGGGNSSPSGLPLAMKYRVGLIAAV